MAAKKILLVDDEEQNIKVLRKWLELHNYTVVTASDGDEVLARAAESQPDLILMDINMRRMNGHIATQQVRADEWTKGIPIIMLTGQADDDDLAQAMRNGATDYVLKPFNLALLANKLKQVLGGGED